MSETGLRNRQIADAQITDSKIAAGAGIKTSKLQDGTEFLKRDGSVAWTGAQNAAGNNFSNLSAATQAGQAVEFSQLQTALANQKALFSSKDPARAASTGTINIASPGNAIDGVTLANGDRVVLKDQTTQSQNGIYVFNGASSPLTRATDFDQWAEVPGSTVAVTEGTTNADIIYLSTANAGGTMGSTAITFVPVGVSSGLQNSNFVDKEVPSGAFNGTNATFTLANTPVLGSEHVYLNGMLQQSGAGNDYTISGSTITLLTTPLTSEKLLVSYRK